MIQPPFNSCCVALQYEPGTKFFHRAVPELHKVEHWCKTYISMHESCIQSIERHKTIDRDYYSSPPLEHASCLDI